MGLRRVWDAFERHLKLVRDAFDMLFDCVRCVKVVLGAFKAR